MLQRARRSVRRRLRRWARQSLPPSRRGRVTVGVSPAKPEPLESFRLFAVLGTWMEEDIVEATVRNAFAQGVEAVYLVDNASADATVERAVAAGATLAESYVTEDYDERLRILFMNAVVARVSYASKADHVWWLWMDADEFPEGPAGMTIAEYLSTLDRRFRLVGSTYYNHYPAAKPESVPGFHPVDFQPLCEQFVALRQRFCDQPHWKHPLQRFDRHDSFLMAIAGFHTATLSSSSSDALLEPEGGIVTHHVPYRQEAATRARMELLCGAPARNAANNALDHRTIARRFASLDAVYAQRWEQVNNLRGQKPFLGVHPTPWPDPSSSRRWYSDEELEAARRSASGARFTPASG
jgi:hypothetical protein